MRGKAKEENKKVPPTANPLPQNAIRRQTTDHPSKPPLRTTEPKHQTKPPPTSWQGGWWRGLQPRIRLCSKTGRLDKGSLAVLARSIISCVSKWQNIYFRFDAEANHQTSFQKICSLTQAGTTVGGPGGRRPSCQVVSERIFWNDVWWFASASMRNINILLFDDASTGAVPSAACMGLGVTFLSRRLGAI